MLATIEIQEEKFKVNLNQPIDISIPLTGNSDDVSAWYVDPAIIEPVRTDHFLGSVNEGGSVNFRNIFFNPHGNGTHTECVGHISKEVFSINKTLTTFFFKAHLISVVPKIYDGVEGEWRKKGDYIITKEILEEALKEASFPDAIIIRTLPNEESKKHFQYSNTNWPYLDEKAAVFLREHGVKHLLIDLPSIDREFDGGKMLAHRAFWNYPGAIRHDATITEIIYVPNEVSDGVYLLNLQIASFENDASPSKPIIYRI